MTNLELPAGISILGTEAAPVIERAGKDVYFTYGELGSDGIDKHWNQIQSGAMVLYHTVEERDRMISTYKPSHGNKLPDEISIL